MIFGSYRVEEKYYLEKYKMTTFEIHFILNGIPYQEIIETTNTYRAKQLLLARYPGAKITSVRQV